MLYSGRYLCLHHLLSIFKILSSHWSIKDKMFSLAEENENQLDTRIVISLL